MIIEDMELSNKAKKKQKRPRPKYKYLYICEKIKSEGLEEQINDTNDNLNCIAYLLNRQELPQDFHKNCCESCMNDKLICYRAYRLIFPIKDMLNGDKDKCSDECLNKLMQYLKGKFYGSLYSENYPEKETYHYCPHGEVIMKYTTNNSGEFPEYDMKLIRKKECYGRYFMV